jgi:hypothetical protein
MSRSADPDTIRFVENALKDEFLNKISGDFVELYKEIDFLADGAPDVRVIKSIQKEILGVFNKVKKKSDRVIDIPTTLRFSIGIFNYWRQSIDLAGSEIQYETIRHFNSVLETRILRPTDEEWQIFFQKIHKLGVWGWEKEYYNLCLDGTGWELSIEHEGKSITSCGGNAYPGVKGIDYGKKFTEFLDALSQLVGSKLAIGNPLPYKEPPQINYKSVIFNSFVPAYQYCVKHGKPVSGKVLNEDIWDAAGVVYARTHKQEIVYIGKTNATLKSRVQDHLRRIPNYSKPEDLRFRRWAEGKTITIFAHKPKNKNYLGLSVPIHTGLEHALIDAIKPTFVSRR